MFFYMVKKEITQALRNKFNLFLLFIFPILSITCMGFALNDLMEGKGDLFKGEKIIYNLNDEDIESRIYVSALEDLCKKLNVDLKAGEVDSNNTIYISINKGEIAYKEGRNNLLNSLIENYLKEVSFSIKVGNLTNIYEVNDKLVLNIISESKIDKGINAFHYYGLVQIVLIIMYLSLTLGESVNREWEDDTIRRIMISKANNILILLSKLVVGVLIGCLQIFEGIVFTKVIIGIDWGIYIKEMVALLVLFSVFSCLFGVVLGFIFRDGKSLSTVINISIIVFSMLGGAYFPISFVKNIPVIGELSKVSPVYWVNEGLINLSIGNFGRVVNIAFIYLTVLIGILIVFYFVYDWLIGERRRGW